jgi:hypothetical protein
MFRTIGQKVGKIDEKSRKEVGDLSLFVKRSRRRTRRQ